MQFSVCFQCECECVRVPRGEAESLSVCGGHSRGEERKKKRETVEGVSGQGL